MKKILSLTMAFLLSASVCLFSACEYLDGFVNNDPVSSNSQSTSSSSSEKTECTAHSFGEWETVKEASCIAGEKQRICENCDFTETEEIPALNDFFAHSFDENTLCATCGHQEFIESEEYIEVSGIVGEKGIYGVIWWNTDRTWGVRIGRTISYNTQLEEYNWASDWTFRSFAGTPIHAILPKSYQGQLLTSLGNQASGAFAWTPSLESIIIPKTVTYIGPWSFQGCTSLTSIFLEKNPKIEQLPLTQCDAILYYYSENEPTEEGNYWHYVDGKPVIWGI